METEPARLGDHVRKRALELGMELAGPLLIVVLVAALLNDHFSGVVSSTNTDIPTQYLLNQCFLGDSLRQGTVPGWNPYLMGGAPFAAEPQSGWMYLPAMLFSVLLPCAKSMSLILVFHLWLAGIGLYAFLRGEGCSRVAATGGGIVLALSAAGSNLVNSSPFGGSLAWTAVVLACASHLFKCRTWSKRLLWMIPIGLAWGQLAAIHLSQGLVMGTVALLAFAGLRMVRAIKAGDLTTLQALGLLAVLLVVLGAVNLAYLLPRLAYLPRSTFSEGFRGLGEIAAEFRGRRPTFGIGKTLAPTFPLRLGLSPGGYLGAISLMLSFAGLFSRRLRGLTLMFLIYGAFFLLAGSGWVVEALEPILLRLPGGEFALHNPGRLAYAVPFALAIATGLGIEAWREGASLRGRFLMILPGVIIFGLLPPIFGADAERLRLLWIGAAVGAAALAVVVRWPRLALVIPLVLAIELSVNQISGGDFEGRYRTGLEAAREWWPLEPVKSSTIDLVDFVSPDPIGERVTSDERGRIVSLMPGVRKFEPVLAGAEEAQGYNPTQVLRYWTFIRFVFPQQQVYSHSFLNVAPKAVQDLLAVGWLAKDGDERVPGILSPVAKEGPFYLFPIEDPTPRVSLVSDVDVVDDDMASLRAVAADGFESERTVVVEVGALDVDEVSSEEGSTEAGEASFEATSTQDVRVEVRAERPSILVVRNTFDRNWTATLDGEPVGVAPVDYLLQGVPLPAGDHVVELAYRDPWIGRGLVGSLLALGALLVAAFTVGRATRRPER
jgi:hypothetical protein